MGDLVISGQPAPQQIVFVAVGPQGAPGTPATKFFYVGPTAPADTTLLWIRTP